MSFVYTTTDNTVKKFNNQSWKVNQSGDVELGFEGFVQGGVLIRRTVLDNEGVLAENTPANCLEMKVNAEGKLVPATNGADVSLGSLASKGNKGDLAKCVTYPVSVNTAGNSALPINSDLVVGAGGRTVVLQAAAIPMGAALAVNANADFVQTNWNNVKTAIIETSVDDPSARGVVVTVHATDKDGKYFKEIITLNETASNTDVRGLKSIGKLLAVEVNQSISTVVLNVKDADGNISAAITAPAAGTLYGSVVTTGTDPLGHSIKIVPSLVLPFGAVIAVLGTDDASLAKVELIVADGVATFYKTKEQFKSITNIIVGADGIATGTYTVTVEANLVGQKIGTNKEAAGANELFLITRV